VTWGKTAAGEEVKLFTLRNANGMEAKITNYGGIIVSLKVADKKGQFADVVLGFDSLEGYLAKNPFFGCITGRYANRIGGAKFKIDGTEYKVTANSGKNHIHGGKIGISTRKSGPRRRSPTVGVELQLHFSADGEEGFPGTLKCTVTYTLTKDNGLKIDYQATTDKPTVLNLTNHSLLQPRRRGQRRHSRPRIDDSATEQITATDDDLITTGEIASIKGTPLDFTMCRTPSASASARTSSH
jgi:aldose 1-epimerase